MRVVTLYQSLVFFSGKRALATTGAGEEAGGAGGEPERRSAARRQEAILPGAPQPAAL